MQYLWEKKTHNFPENVEKEKYSFTTTTNQETSCKEIPSFCEGFKIHVVKSA